MKKDACAYGGYVYQDISMPLVRCPVCGLKYIDYELSDELRELLYNEHAYFESAYAGGGGQGNYVENRERQEEKARHALDTIARFKKDGSLFEVGCAGGYLLHLAQERGYRVSGVEMSQEMAAHARAQGLEVVTGELHDVPKGKIFDVVYLGGVLEHVNNPLQFVREIAERVVKGGIIAIEVPLTYNLTLPGLVIGCMQALRGHFGYQYFLPAQHRGRLTRENPYHLSFFNHSSLLAVMRRADLTVRYLSIYEGAPKQKFSGSGYSFLKGVINFLPRWIGLNCLGDRAFVVARKD
ncbi:class I SAM-dependent methyltransferase [Candidatus Kaiserbacteria bacterium]|nr:class I SAM-dependent methyltransferase [Candidatus Kaiserbacteria bacterium]